MARDHRDRRVRSPTIQRASFRYWQAIYDVTARYCTSTLDLDLPIIKYLVGQPDEAIRLVETELAKIQNKTGAAEEHYRKKAAALIVLCKTKPV